jgi:hypothetical protein
VVVPLAINAGKTASRYHECLVEILMLRLTMGRHTVTMALRNKRHEPEAKLRKFIVAL